MLALVSFNALAETARVGAELFTNGVIPRIQIEINPDALASLRKDAREFVAAKVTEGGGSFQQVAIRLKGATGSFQTIDDKPAMTLDFSRFQSGQKFHGLRRIHLNNSAEDPSYANEKLGSEMFLAAGVPAPRVTRAVVELNGKSLGLYVLKEGFTEDFLARHFNKVGGELYEPETGHDVNEKLERNSVDAPADKNRTALKKLSVAALDEDASRRWKKLDASLDTKEFLNFMAMEIMLGHRDGYCIARNNFRVYHDLDSDKIVFFPHGLDQLLGTADLPWQPHLAGLVAQAVMETPEGKSAFEATFRALLEKIFVVEQLTNRVEQLVQELRPLLSSTEFARAKAEAELVKERIANRKSSLLAQLNQLPQQPLDFAEGAARPDGWKAGSAQNGRLDRVELDGAPALRIAASAETSASWRARVLIPRGHYRFEGRVKIASVEPLPFGSHQGANLRIGGARATNSFIGDSQWRVLSTELAVAEPAREVELICELRARAGEAWFDLDSLRIVKLRDL